MTVSTDLHTILAWLLTAAACGAGWSLGVFVFGAVVGVLRKFNLGVKERG